MGVLDRIPRSRGDYINDQPFFMETKNSMPSILQEEIAFVKEQITRTAKLHEKKPYEGSKLPEVIANFERVLVQLENYQNSLESPNVGLPSASALPLNGPQLFTQEQLYLRPKDLEGLPPDLLAQISISKSDKLEHSILQCVEESGGIISIEVLLVKLYRSTGEVYDRNKLSTKLFRMSKKQLIFSVPKKKAVYSLNPIDPSLLEDEPDEE